MMGVDVTEDLQEVKSQQALLFASVASNIVFQSSARIVEEDEMCSHFFFQKVHREKFVLSSLKEEDGSVASSQSVILRIRRLDDMKLTDSVASQLFLSSIMEVLEGSKRTDYLKVLGIRFRGAGADTKSWEERIAKVRQKLGFWDHRSLSIAAKNLVIRFTQAIIHFIWRSKMDCVSRDTIYKTLDKRDKNLANAALILMATFHFKPMAP
eukprot:g36626.t1